MAVQNAPTNSPASFSLPQVLAAPNMMGYLLQCKSGIPPVLPPEFYMTTQKVIGDYATLFFSTGNRQTARRAPYSTSHKERTLRQLGQRQYKLIPTYEKIRLPVQLYMQMLDPNTKGMEIKRQLETQTEAYRQVSEAKRVLSNLRIGCMVSACVYGQIQFDELGNLLAPTAALPNGGLSIPFPIPNGTTGIPIPDTKTIGTNLTLTNAAGLDPLATGTPVLGVPVGDWALASTHIDQQIINLKKAAVQLTGYPITKCFYGSNVAPYVMNNSWMAEYLKRDSYNQKYLDTGEIPQGVMGLEWHYAGDGFFYDQTNTIQQLVGPNRVMFTCDNNAGGADQTIGIIEGSNIVPSDVGECFPDGSVAEHSKHLIYGQYSYGKEEHDPYAIDVYFGDTFLPAMTNPLVFFATEVH